VLRRAVEAEEDKPVQALTIEAATPESGLKLYNALSRFHPELELDDEDRQLIIVWFDTDREIADLLDTLHRFLDQRMNGDESVSSVCVATAGRSYNLHA
jgi:hypothetical protein